MIRSLNIDYSGPIGHDIFAVIKELKRLQKIKDLNSYI
jgi:1-deoxy-D-xylulose-5-phosphate synthase